MAVVTAVWDLALEGGPLGSQGITRGAWATDNCMKQMGHLSSEFHTKDKRTSSLSRALLFGLPGAQSQAYVLGGCSGMLLMGPVPGELHPHKLSISGLILGDDSSFHLLGLTLDQSSSGRSLHSGLDSLWHLVLCSSGGSPKTGLWDPFLRPSHPS